MKKLKIFSILPLFIFVLSACSSVDGSEDSNGLAEIGNAVDITSQEYAYNSLAFARIEAAVEEIEIAISELEAELAELLADEAVMERIENMSMKIDGRTRISANDIYMDEDLGSILSRADALRRRAGHIGGVEIPAYVLDNPDLYDASCGNPEATTQCSPGQLQTQLEYLRIRLGNLFPFNMTRG